MRHKKPRRRRRQLTRQLVVNALQQTYGLVAPAAELLGVERRSLQRAIARYNLQDLQRQLREEVIGDIAELRLFEAIKEGKPWAVAFYLKTLGKNRGYVERQEIASVGEVQIELVETDGTK